MLDVDTNEVEVISIVVTMECAVIGDGVTIIVGAAVVGFTVGIAVVGAVVVGVDVVGVAVVGAVVGAAVVGDDVVGDIVGCNVIKQLPLNDLVDSSI